ncbi:hypothetical protein VPH35_008419 [Triticum aestivum]
MQLTPTTSSFLWHARAPPPPPATREPTPSRRPTFSGAANPSQPPPCAPSSSATYPATRPTSSAAASHSPWSGQRASASHPPLSGQRATAQAPGPVPRSPPETNPSKVRPHTATHCGVQAKCAPPLIPFWISPVVLLLPSTPPRSGDLPSIWSPVDNTTVVPCRHLD